MGKNIEKVIDFFASKEVEKNIENKPRNDEAVAIAFSCKVVDLLKEKMRIHNKSHPKAKVSLSDLKAVYRHGATMNDENRSLGLRALARVGMYLQMKIGYSGEGFKNLLRQVTLRDSLLYMKNSSIDVSDSLLPSEEDFLLAEEEIKDKGLDYDFKSIDDLYLEDYDKDSWKWQW